MPVPFFPAAICGAPGADICGDCRRRSYPRLRIMYIMLNCIDATGSTPAIPCLSARSKRQPHSLASHGISCHASTTAHGLGFGPCRPEVNGRNAAPPFLDSLRGQQRQVVELTGTTVDPLAPRVCAFASLFGWRCERSRAIHGGARRPWHWLAISIHQAPKTDRQRAGLWRG